MRHPCLTDTGTLSSFVAKGCTLPGCLSSCKCMHAYMQNSTSSLIQLNYIKKRYICTNFPSLIPRPERRRKEGLVPIAHACANYPKKTWGAANDCTFFRPPLTPRVRSDVDIGVASYSRPREEGRKSVQ